MKGMAITLGVLTAVAGAAVIGFEFGKDRAGSAPKQVAALELPLAEAKREALKLDAECRGGQHSQSDPVCANRDEAFSDLGERGVCWAYSDAGVPAAKYDWHDCDVERPVASSTAPAPTTAPHRYTARQYAQLRPGMPFPMVVKIMGDAGEETASDEAGGYGHRFVRWQNQDGSSLSGQFENGFLASKAQYGLK